MYNTSKKIRAHCTRTSSTGSQTGTLVFQGDRLRFHCDPPLLQSDFIPLHSVSNVRFDGSQLTIWMPRQIHYQTNRGSLRDIYIAIHQYLNNEDSETLDFNELLLFGPAHSKRVQGTIHLTTSELRFYSNTPEDHISVPLQDIKDIQITHHILSLGTSVEVHFGKQKHTFSGENANKLYGFLKAIGYGGQVSIPLFFWECLYKAGLMEWNVLCVLTDEALMIVPTNPYFGTLSGQGFLIPHNEVCQLDYHSKATTITLLSGDEIHLRAEYATNRFKKLSETLYQWQSPVLQIGTTSNHKIKHPYLKQTLESLHSERFIVGACGRLHTAKPMLLGWLALTESELIFIPRNPTIPIEKYSLEDICRNDEFDTPLHYLALRIKNENVAFAMAGGEDYLDAFFEVFQPPRRYLKWPEFQGIVQTAREHKLPVFIQGAPESIEGIFDFQKDFVLLIPKQAKIAKFTSQTLNIKFDTADGTYTFKSKGLRIVDVPVGEQQLLYLEPPQQAAFYNLRSAIRIDLKAFVTAVRMDLADKKETLRGLLLNLSEAGCGLEAKADLQHKENILISLPSTTYPLEIIGEVVNIRNSNSPGYKHYGIQFTDNSPRNRRRINQFILKTQAQDAEEEDFPLEG